MANQKSRKALSKVPSLWAHEWRAEGPRVRMGPGKTKRVFNIRLDAPEPHYRWNFMSTFLPL